MVLKGGDKGESIPFDAPLYDINRERGIEYRNCDALAAVFMITGDISEILPEGLEPFSDPPQGAIWISGELGYYIPYIYVTNDAAMAAGRELAGAPKKLADIDIKNELDFLQGTLERPAGKRLITFTFKPVERAMGDVVEAYFPYPTPLLSVRHLPWVKEPGDGVTQLISWYAEIDFHKDPKGESTIWMGPASITYDSPSEFDPVHKLKFDEVLAALYFQFDMKLNVKEVQKEY